MAGQADLLAVVDAGGNGDRDFAALFDRSVSAAGFTGLMDELTGAVAAARRREARESMGGTAPGIRI